MILSILICTVPERKEMFTALYKDLYTQSFGLPVEIIPSPESLNAALIGTKRNRLLNQANGEYVCFVDDDDTVSSTYVKDILKALELKPDCVSLRGVITWDGGNPELFEHSIKYSDWVTTTSDIKYLRPPNHLNTIKSSIAKQFKFLEINHGEDKDWSLQIRDSGLLKKEVFIERVLYHYLYITNKNVAKT